MTINGEIKEVIPGQGIQIWVLMQNIERIEYCEN